MTTYFSVQHKLMWYNSGKGKKCQQIVNCTKERGSMLAALKFPELKFSKKEIKIQNLPIDKIRPNPYQPRKYFDKTALEELPSGNMALCSLLMCA